jgi:hypothetical protein
LSFAFIALGKGLIEPPLQFSVGAPKIGYFVVEYRGHVRTPSRPAPDRMILDRHRSSREGARLDHLLVESVKRIRGLADLTG